MLPTVGWWGNARLRVAWFLANIWQGPGWPSVAGALAASSGSRDRKRLARPVHCLSSDFASTAVTRLTRSRCRPQRLTVSSGGFKGIRVRVGADEHEAHRQVEPGLEV